MSSLSKWTRRGRRYRGSRLQESRGVTGAFACPAPRRPPANGRLDEVPRRVEAQGRDRHPGWGSWARVASTATSLRHHSPFESTGVCVTMSSSRGEAHTRVGRQTPSGGAQDGAPAADGRRRAHGLCSWRRHGAQGASMRQANTRPYSHCHRTAQGPLGNEQRSAAVVEPRRRPWPCQSGRVGVSCAGRPPFPGQGRAIRGRGSGRGGGGVVRGVRGGRSSHLGGSGAMVLLENKMPSPTTCGAASVEQPEGPTRTGWKHNGPVCTCSRHSTTRCIHRVRSHGCGGCASGEPRPRPPLLTANLARAATRVPRRRVRKHVVWRRARSPSRG